MAECSHREHEYVALDNGKEYGICKRCLRIDEGWVARLNDA